MRPASRKDPTLEIFVSERMAGHFAQPAEFSSCVEGSGNKGGSEERLREAEESSSATPLEVVVIQLK